MPARATDGTQKVIFLLSYGLSFYFLLEKPPYFLPLADVGAYLVNNFLNLANPLMIFKDIVAADELRF